MHALIDCEILSFGILNGFPKGTNAELDGPYDDPTSNWQIGYH